MMKETEKLVVGEYTMRETFKFLFPEEVSLIRGENGCTEQLSKKYESFKAYVINDIQKSECDVLVLYRLDKKFRRFMNENNLDCKKREIIIRGDGSRPTFFEDYSKGSISNASYVPHKSRL